jgi:hypothetical protein
MRENIGAVGGGVRLWDGSPPVFFTDRGVSIPIFMKSQEHFNSRRKSPPPPPPPPHPSIFLADDQKI